MTFKHFKHSIRIFFHKFPKNLIESEPSWYFWNSPQINALQMLQRSWITVSQKNFKNIYFPLFETITQIPQEFNHTRYFLAFLKLPPCICPSNALKVIDSIWFSLNFRFRKVAFKTFLVIKAWVLLFKTQAS